MVKALIFVTALATLAAAAPSDILAPRACPNLASIAAIAGCQVSNASDCEICCPTGINPGSQCHAGHDVPDPCAPNGKQYHCDAD